MITSLRAFLDDRRSLIPILAEMHRADAFRLYRSRPDGEADFAFDGTKMRPDLRAHVAAMFGITGRAIAACLDLYCLMRLHGEGPKVFRPTAAECLALEEVQVRVPVSAYAQPFPTFCVEFPPEYRAARRTVGEGVHGGTVSYSPVAQVLAHVAGHGIIAGATITDSPDGATLCGMIGSPDAATIEDDIQKQLGDANTQPVNSDELTTERRAVRVALNACLMLMDRGFRKLPHGVEAEGLSKQLRAKRTTKPGVLDDLRARRQAIPTEFAFVQAVDVRRAVRGAVPDDVADDVAGRRVRPHWRSAHWRMQRHGVGLTQSKRVLIPHVMVNAADFGGSDSETLVIQS
jgi:hypothetical protein